MSKQTFACSTFAARSFAGGGWAGVGAEVEPEPESPSTPGGGGTGSEGASVSLLPGGDLTRRHSDGGGLRAALEWASLLEDALGERVSVPPAVCRLRFSASVPRVVLPDPPAPPPVVGVRVRVSRGVLSVGVSARLPHVVALASIVRGNLTLGVWAHSPRVVTGAVVPLAAPPGLGWQFKTGRAVRAGDLYRQQREREEQLVSLLHRATDNELAYLFGDRTRLRG
jgi:hypothetical protein